VTERERHRAFVERSSDIVTALDANGTFQYASPSVERILGHDPADLVGEYAFEYVHPEDRERVVEVFAQSVTGDEPNPTVEYRLADADGGYLWVESVGSNRLDDHGVSGFVINTRDISERKQREEKLSRLREWTRDLNYTRTVAETTQLAVDAADEIVGAGLSGIHLVNEAGDALEPAALAESVPSFFDEQPSYDRDSPPGRARPSRGTRTAATSRSPSATCRRTIVSTRRRPPRASCSIRSATTGCSSSPRRSRTRSPRLTCSSRRSSRTISKPR